jgi:A/G-specific adenine glycosylase
MNDREILSRALPLIRDWYAENRRPLPWRGSPSAYEVWISEIMLQQTRIETVIPYYERFLAAAPDLPALAALEEDRLLKLWEGLGYYSRARNLQKAAKLVMERYGGELPSSAEELRSLPGIGDYTAGAIASIAFAQPEPAVDGNVLRVLTRLLACGEDIASSSVRRAFTALLRDLYPSGEDAGLLTQGLMELGETICLPGGEIRCDVCPVRGLCRAAEAGTVDRYPVKTPPKARKIEQRTVLLLHCGGKIAIRQRESKGLLAGLWEFPSLDGTVPPEELQSLFPEARTIVLCGEAKHLFSHVEWHMTGYALELGAERPEYRWVSPEEIRTVYSFPSAFRYYLRRI